MQNAARENYLVTEVMTAAPQRLQLMLIEAALRFGRQGREQWQAGNQEAASESILRCQRIMAQLLGGLKSDVDSELVRQVAAVYLFIFRSLVMALMHRDLGLLDEALAVLSEEQETWRQVCAKLGGNLPDESRPRLALEG